MATTRRSQPTHKSSGSGTDAFREKLREYGITTDEARELGISWATATPDGKWPISGLLIRYPAPYEDFWRYRFHPNLPLPRNKTKPIKYAQPAKSSCVPYISPLMDWGDLPADADICITEGEIKSIIACKHGIPTIGLGGVWNFNSKNGLGEQSFVLEGFPLEGRRVNIVFDSDAVVNDSVRKAEFALARQLSLRGARVFIARLPDDQGGVKVGMDDFILRNGVDDLKQIIADASEFAEAVSLHKLNQEITLVVNPSIYYVKHTHDPKGFAPYLDVGAIRSSREMSETLLPHRIVVDNGDKKVVRPLFDIWNSWASRMTVRRMSYAPGEQTIENGILNLWTGWGVNPIPEGSTPDVGPWDSLLSLLFAPEDAHLRQWFERWCAYPIQFPGTKILSCVIMSSRQHGVGKSFVSEILARIYGRAGDVAQGKLLNGTENVNAGKIDLNALTSGRNDWVRCKQFAFGEDVRGTTMQESREIRDQLKDAVTRSTVRIDEKYVKAVEFPDKCNLMFSTNDPTNFHMDDEDRRFFVYNSRAMPESQEFYQRIDTWAKSYGPAHLHRYFLDMDLGDFNPMGRPPVTETKRMVMAMNRSWVDDWALQLKENPEVVLVGSSGRPLFWTYSFNELFALYSACRSDDKVLRPMFDRALLAADIHRCVLPCKVRGGTQVIYFPRGVPEELKNADQSPATVAVFHDHERTVSVRPSGSASKIRGRGDKVGVPPAESAQPSGQGRVGGGNATPPASARRASGRKAT